MNNNINLKKITKENLSLACQIQNKIFPNEDGTVNYIEAVEKNPYRKELDFYIAYDKDTPIGVTGIYSYNEYPEDAWLSWFGLLPEFRKKGYGGIIFDKTVELAKEKGYKNFRLYTDETFCNARGLYAKKGMIAEVYDNPDDKDPFFPEDMPTFIYSMSLTNKPVDLWDNKLLGLREQGLKEHEKDNLEE